MAQLVFTQQLGRFMEVPAVDTDAGDYTATTPTHVRVALGSLTTASGPQTVTFAVTIN